MAGPTIFVRHKSQKELISVLTPYLPHSLPTIRRLQFLSFPGSSTAETHTLSSFDDGTPSLPFVIAYLDLSRGPETEMLLFSTLELGTHTPEQEALAEQQILSIFAKSGELEKTYSLADSRPRKTPGQVLAGAVHETIVNVLKKHNLVTWHTEAHHTFVFDTDSLPPVPQLPREDLHWGWVRPQDIPLVLSRTDIPRQTKTLLTLPSVAVFSKEEEHPVSWAFLGQDGSLTSLATEVPYRRIGLAKAMTLKMFKEKMFGDDKFAHEYVMVSNLQSQGVARGLGGKELHLVYWILVRMNI